MDLTALPHELKIALFILIPYFVVVFGTIAGGTILKALHPDLDEQS